MWPALIVAVLPGLCLAPQTPPEPAPAQRVEVAEMFLADKLTFWQGKLNLQDWDIQLTQATQKELRGGTLGNIHWDQPKKTAHIRVLSADEYETTFEAALRDMEFTVVHELIHLEFASLPRSEASRRDEEHAVDRVAEALLAFDRGE